MAASLLAPTVALAAEAKPLNLQTSPLPISLSTPPGKAVSADLKVKQNSGSDARLKVSLMKFSAFGEEGKPRLIEREPGDDYFDWVRFDKTNFAAPNNVWQTVKMTINVPKTAAFGYYYAVVFSRVGDDTKKGERTTAFNGGTAVLVLLNAESPNAKRELSVVSFASKHRIYEFLPGHLDVKFENTGNVHSVPKGSVFIMKGKKQVAVLNVNAESGNILPKTKRTYPVLWPDGFPVWKEANENGKVKLDAKGQPVRELTWDLKDLAKFRLGKYTAHLFAVYDDGKGRDVPLEAEVSFWVIPWRILLVVLAVVALVAFGAWVMLRGAWRGARRIGGRGRRRS